MTRYATTTNGSSHGYTIGGDERDQIATALPRMDGRLLWALSMWPLPPGIDFDDVDYEQASSYYLQCAGSAAAMTVEIRERTPEGPRHYVLGWAPTTGGADVELEFDEFAVYVHPEEVFTAEQASEVFGEYIATGTVGGRWHRRLLTERE